VRLVVGVILVAFVAISEALIGFMLRPAVDYVLDPVKFGSSLPLVTLPWNGQVIYLNKIFPSSIHNVWTMFAISILVLYVSKAIAEYLGMTGIQYVGLAATRDLRNEFYEKVIKQPMGFFQHNPTGRIISIAINDIDPCGLR